MKTKKKLLINYLFSIGFIFLIVIFLSSIVFISRTVLSNAQEPISDHVKNTQNILEDILEVESITKSSAQNSSNYINNNNKFLNSNSTSLKIFDEAYINVDENKSIFTFFIDGEIVKLNNSYYKKLKNFSKLLTKDTIAYNSNEIGNILEIKNEKLKVLNSNTHKIDSINSNDILGIVFLEK